MEILHLSILQGRKKMRLEYNISEYYFHVLEFSGNFQSVQSDESSIGPLSMTTPGKSEEKLYLHSQKHVLSSEGKIKTVKLLKAVMDVWGQVHLIGSALTLGA